MVNILLGIAISISFTKYCESLILDSAPKYQTTAYSLGSVKEMKLPPLDPNIAEDARLNTSQLIEKYGYEMEVHHVKTDDGYILEMHRILGSPKSPPRESKKVVFLMHGLLDSSATWVLTGPSHGLGFKLADAGYDVWMGNARGNKYSTNHAKFKPYGCYFSRKHFWSFSWHEIGIYDLPASIDYILKKTKQIAIQYVGHSQGTTAFFVMCSEKPEYNSKVSLMHALAPVGFLSHVSSPPLRALAPLSSFFQKTSRLLGIFDIAPSSDCMKLIGRDMCRDKAVTQCLCENIFFLTMGYNSNQLNGTLLPVILAHTPAGAATNQFLHYAQEMKSGHFRQFDYGFVENLVRYKRFTPPDYNLKKIRVPIALYYSHGDWLATAKDVKRLLRALPNIIEDYIIPNRGFNHIDFTWGTDAPALLFNHILKVMDSIHGTENEAKNKIKK